MKQQVVGFVVSALLFSVFGHEYYSRHQLDRSARIAHSRAKSPVLFHTRKHHEDNECTPVCYIPGRQPCGKLTVYHCPTSGLVSVTNETIKVALVIDTNANLEAIFYQPKETLILINWETGTGVIISGEVTKEVGWHTKDAFQPYFKKITSLATYWSFGEKNSGKFEISDVKSEIAVLIQSTLQVLSSGDYYFSEHEAADFLVTLSASWAAAIKETSGLVEGGSVTDETSLKLVIGAYQGLALVASRVKDGITEKHITVSLETLIKTKSPYELTASLAIAFVRQGVNVEEILGDISKNRVTLFETLTTAGGNSSEGLTGVIRVLLEVVLVAHDQGSVQRVVDILVDFYTNNPNLNYKQLIARFERSLKNMLQMFKRAQVERQVKSWIKDLEAILEHKSEENDVDVSEILNLILATDGSTPLKRIIRIVIVLQKKTAPEAIGYLFFKLFEYLVQNQIYVIINLYPEVKINDNGKNVIASILRYLNTTELSSKDDCIHALSKAPVITDVVQGVNNTLCEFTNGSITLKTLIRSQSFFKYIQLIEQIIVNINRSETTTEASSSNKTDSAHNSDANGSSKNSSEQPSKHSSHKTGDSNGNGKGGDGGNVEISKVGNGNSDSTNIQINNSGGKGGHVSSEGGQEKHDHSDSGSGDENYTGGNSSADGDGGKGGNTKVSDTGNGSKNTNIVIDTSGGNAGDVSSKVDEARSKGRHHTKGHEKHNEKH